MTRQALFEAGKRASAVLRDLEIKQELYDTGRLRIDPIQLASQLDVIVVFKKLQKLLGAYVYTNEQAGILLNYDRPFGLVTMTCAHELGHYALQHDSMLDTMVEYDSAASLQELQADAFAYALLLPNWLLQRVMGIEGITKRQLNCPELIYQLSLRFGLSYSAMVWLLFRKKILAQKEARKLSSVQPKTIKSTLKSRLHLEVHGNHSDIWILTQGYQDYVIEPKVGDSVIVELRSHPSAGMAWLHKDSKLAISPILVPPQRNQFSQSSEFAGSYIIPHRVDGIDNFIGKRPAKIQLIERREFVKDNSIYQEFSVGAQTHVMEKGLSAYERRSRLSE